MKTKSTHFMAVFFALSLAGIATVSHASDSASPFDSAGNVISDHEDVMNHDGEGDQDLSINHEPVPYDHDHPGRIDQCRQNDGNVYYCQQTPGCVFDEFSNICRSGGGAGGGQYCQAFHRNEYQCLNEGCSYDRYSGRCSGQGGQQPRPRPQYCQQYNYREYECQDAGCMYDMRSGLCRAQGQIPQPGYSFACTAIDSGFEEHYNGHQGIGQSQYAAQQAAMGDCMRHHASCRITRCQRR